MDVAEACLISKAYRQIYFPDAIGEVLPEEVMDFHLGICLLVAEDIFSRLVLPIKLLLFTRFIQGVISI